MAVSLVMAILLRFQLCLFLLLLNRKIGKTCCQRAALINDPAME